MRDNICIWEALNSELGRDTDFEVIKFEQIVGTVVRYHRLSVISKLLDLMLIAIGLLRMLVMSCSSSLSWTSTTTLHLTRHSKSSDGLLLGSHEGVILVGSCVLLGCIGDELDICFFSATDMGNG